MEFFTDIATRVASVRDLTGEVESSDLLPEAIDRLDDAEALELLGLAAGIGQMAERLRVSAAGVVARRSSRATGHSGLAQSKGHRNAVSLVQQVTGATRADAAKQVRVGESLYDTVGVAVAPGGGGTSVLDAEGVSGGDRGDGDADAAAVLAGAVPWHAPLGRALLEGSISAAQHDAITRGLGKPPGHELQMDLPAVNCGSEADRRLRAASTAEAAEYATAWSVAATQLVAEAERRTVEELAKAARSLRDQLDPVGAERRYSERYEARSFRMWTDRDGIARASLVFDDLSATWVRSVRDAALRPRRGGPRFVDPDEQARADELAADPRTNEQLAFDLFIDVLRAGALADAESVYGARQAGVRLVQVVDTVEEGSAPALVGPAHTEDGIHALPAWVARQQACTTSVTGLRVDRAGNPLDLGRAKRLYSPAQRLALAIRDGGCRWKECDRPASYCEAHHIDEWSTGSGRTDIDRGLLLCAFHHLQLHHGGWRITRHGTDDFVLHDPGGGQTVLPPRLELRYAWAGIDPPTRRFRLAA